MKKPPLESEIVIMESCAERTITVAPMSGSRLVESTITPHNFPVGFWAETMWQTNNIADRNREILREIKIQELAFCVIFSKISFFENIYVFLNNYLINLLSVKEEWGILEMFAKKYGRKMGEEILFDFLFAEFVKIICGLCPVESCNL